MAYFTLEKDKEISEMTIDPKEIKYTESTKQITRPMHPELADVKPWDELLVVNFGEEEKQDPLHTALQNRIEELNKDVDGEDDDEGGAPVPALRWYSNWVRKSTPK